MANMDSLTKELFEAVAKDTEIWNNKVRNPEKRRELEIENAKMRQRAYETAQELSKPSYVDLHKKYIG